MLKVLQRNSLTKHRKCEAAHWQTAAKLAPGDVGSWAPIAGTLQGDIRSKSRLDGFPQTTDHPGCRGQSCGGDINILYHTGHKQARASMYCIIQYRTQAGSQKTSIIAQGKTQRVVSIAWGMTHEGRQRPKIFSNAIIQKLNNLQF